MLDLATLQSRMSGAVLSGDFSAIASEFVAPGATPQRRLGIFRNNTILSLTAALSATFPATVALVDKRFFDYAAASFIAAHPPREARLSVYGGEFPRFLARFPAMAKFPFVAGVAALEWAIAEVLDETELPAMTGPAGADIALQPCLRFIASRFDVAALWNAFHATRVDRIDPTRRKPTRLAIWRHGAKIRFAELTPPAFTFWRSLAKGRPLDRAAAAAMARDPLFDLTQELVTLIRAGLIVNRPQQELTP
jgi:Putative DNA-binding domain